jgi:ABC-type lipoprotein export system ATPase subunit
MPEQGNEMTMLPAAISGPAIQQQDHSKAEEQKASPDKSAAEAPSSSHISSTSRYLQFLRKLNDHWKDCPDVYISFKDLQYQVTLPVKDEQGIPSFVSVGANALKRLIIDKLHLGKGVKYQQFNVLSKVSGVIKPGTTTLVLAPPGHGKTAFLKALAGRFNGSKNVSGNIYYNGETNDELKAKRVYVSKLTAYMGQSDIHFPILTVKETLDFAAKSAVADAKLLENDELTQLEEDRAKLMVNLLGLDECTDTIIGNDLLRGVSGGKKKSSRNSNAN